jgi:acyl-CoA synthetase (AMP-forming)/AMP-acid ligase II
MLHHGALLHNVEGCLGVIAEDFGWDDEVFLSFLPASHAYEHTGGQMFPIGLGAEIYYAEGIEKLAANIEETRPTIMVVVPRLFEVLRQRILKEVEKQGKLPAYLMKRALDIGAKDYAGRLPLWDRPMDFLLDRLLRPKIGAKFGGRIKAMVSGGAPLTPEVGIFFHSLGLTFLQGYGQTEAAPVISCNRPSAGIKLDTVGPPLKNTEVRIAEDGEILVRGELVMKGYWRNPGPHRADGGRRLAAHRRRRPYRRQGPDRHHRPQEGPDRPRQGRQCRSAAGRGHADPPARDRAGDGPRRPAALPGRPDRPGGRLDRRMGEGERQAERPRRASRRSRTITGRWRPRSTG